jgi:hypothetical protein
MVVLFFSRRRLMTTFESQHTSIGYEFHLAPAVPTAFFAETPMIAQNIFACRAEPRENFTRNA